MFFKKKNRLHGKTAFITGASGGIGLAVAKLFQEKNIRCVLCDIHPPELSYQDNPNILFVSCDITKQNEIDIAIEKALKNFGSLDILINCAGIIHPASFENLTWQQIEKQIDVNLLGTMRITQTMIEIFKKQNSGGNIVSISSLSGIVPETYSAVYTASKFALRGFFQTLHIELKNHGIFVGTIFPDAVDTAMLRYEAKHGGSPLTFLSKPAKAEEVARAVLSSMCHQKIEIYVPRFSAFFPKLLETIPAVIPLLWGILEKIGERKKEIYQNKMK